MVRLARLVRGITVHSVESVLIGGLARLHFFRVPLSVATGQLCLFVSPMVYGRQFSVLLAPE